VAPSPELRKWFGHDPEKWPEFRRRYREELRDRPADLERLRRLSTDGPVTFVSAAKDTERNSATVLRDVLEQGPDAAKRRVAAA
jgi:uncharacterized protein YeaO (DUF488 family)